MMKKLSTGLIFLLSIFFFISAPASGFKLETRQAILGDAIRFCPAELKSYLELNRDIVTEGMLFADRIPAVKMDPFETKKIYSELVERIKNGRSKEYNTVISFGVLACFIAESICPGPFYTSCNMVPAAVSYDGFNEVGNIDSHTADMLETYRGPYKEDQRIEVTSVLYPVAVNEIVDFWTSAWKAGGHGIGNLCDVGTEIKHGPEAHFPEARKP
jgi:hypothetical protein